jgi:hypothetical protein
MATTFLAAVWLLQMAGAPLTLPAPAVPAVAEASSTQITTK